MDPRIAWLMPEQMGPAADVYQRFAQSWAERCNDDQDESALAGNPMMQNVMGGNGQMPPPGAMFNPNLPKKPMGPTTEQLDHLRHQKKELLERFGIDELSPIAKNRDGISDNPATTNNVGYNTFKKYSSTVHPWKRKNISSGVPGLHQEIVDFYKWIMATPEEYTMRFEVVLRVEEVIKQEFPGARVEVFGSFQTGLYLPTSDIDMVVFHDFPPHSNPYYHLQERLVNQGIAERLSIKVIAGAAVPIVKMRDMLTDIKVDISFNMQSGVTSVALIKEFIREFPALEYLVLLLKQFLLQRDMNEVWTGGISSYGLILMVVSFLQHHPRESEENLGVLLIEFFQLYGRQFNYQKCCIRVKNGGQYMKKEDMAAQMKAENGGSIGKYTPNFLSIEDPLTPSNDIGRASHGAETVKDAFEYAYRVLTRAVSPQACSYPSGCTDSILGRIILVTDEVYQCRRWVLKHWKIRVPRLLPLTESEVTVHDPAAQNSEVNSLVSNSDDSQDETANVNVGNNRPYQDRIKEGESANELRPYSNSEDDADKSHDSSEADDDQSSTDGEGEEESAVPPHYYQERRNQKYGNQNYDVVEDPGYYRQRYNDDFDQKRRRYGRKSRELLPDMQRRSNGDRPNNGPYDAGESHRRHKTDDRANINPLDAATRGARSSQSDTASVAEQSDSHSVSNMNPKSPGGTTLSATSPSKRTVNIHGGLFSKALHGAVSAAERTVKLRKPKEPSNNQTGAGNQERPVKRENEMYQPRPNGPSNPPLQANRVRERRKPHDRRSDNYANRVAHGDSKTFEEPFDDRESLHSRSTRSRRSSESRGSPAPRDDYFNGKESPVSVQAQRGAKMMGDSVSSGKHRYNPRDDQSSPIMNGPNSYNGNPHYPPHRHMRYQRNHDPQQHYMNNRSSRSAMDDPTGYRGGGSARMDQDPAEFPTDRNHREMRLNNMDRGYGRSDRRQKDRKKEIEMYQPQRRSNEFQGQREGYDGVNDMRRGDRMDLGRSRLSAENQMRNRRPEYSP